MIVFASMKPIPPEFKQVVIRRIRVKKEESAFIYTVLEANEGIASYSTLDHPVGAAYRDLELQIPVKFEEDVDRVLKELGDMIYDLESERSPSRVRSED